MNRGYDHFVVNGSIQNIFTRRRYQKVWQNLHFADNTKQNETGKCCKIGPIIDHLNESFEAVGSVMKWGWNRNLWNSDLNEMLWNGDLNGPLWNGDLNVGFDVLVPLANFTNLILYLGWKKDVEVNLGEKVVMQLPEKLKGTYCTLFFDNFFNRSVLINELSEDGIYAAIETVQSNWKQILQLKEDKKMFRGKINFHFSKNINSCNWYGSKQQMLMVYVEHIT